MNLAARIFATLAAKADGPSLRVLDACHEPAARWSAAALLGECSRWCEAYRSGGIEVGDAVAIEAPRNHSLAAMHLGALAAGATIVPLNPALTDTEASRVLAACSPKVVATTAAFARRLEQSASPLQAPWWVADDADGDTQTAFEPPPLPATIPPWSTVEIADDEDAPPALLLFTSGTTGLPKSVPLSHANLTANLDTLAALWKRSGKDRILHVLPAHHFHGLVLALYGALLAGEEIVLMQRFDARATLDAIKRHEVDLMMGVPTMYARMIDAADTSDSLAGLRLAISGSAPLGRALFERFQKRFGVVLVERYGLTETGIVSANPPDRARGGSVGLPLRATEVVVRMGDAYVAASPGHAGEQGEICVAGPSVTRGYGNDAAATAAAFRDGRFHTGDLGHFDEDGYLWIDGRLKELIIVGGSNVVPGEVESALQEVEGIAEIAVAGVPDKDLGEVVCAFVVARASEDPASHASLEERLRGAAEAALARYKRPRRYVFVDDLPRNAMGKIDRARLLSGGP